MIKVVDTGIYIDHEGCVREAVNQLQDSGNEVIKIERVSRSYLFFLGDDVTHIHYRKLDETD